MKFVAGTTSLVGKYPFWSFLLWSLIRSFGFGIVYKVRCKTTEAIYIGNTQQNSKIEWQDIRPGSKPSPLQMGEKMEFSVLWKGNPSQYKKHLLRKNVRYV